MCPEKPIAYVPQEEGEQKCRWTGGEGGGRVQCSSYLSSQRPGEHLHLLWDNVIIITIINDLCVKSKKEAQVEEEDDG